MKKLFLPLLLFVAVSAQAADNNPVLTIEGGQVQGVLADDHPDVFVYRGIPYAAPPIRENRWKEPQPVQPWKGVKISELSGHSVYGWLLYRVGLWQGGRLQRRLSVSERMDKGAW